MLQLNPNFNRDNPRLPFNCFVNWVSQTRLTHKQNQNQWSLKRVVVTPGKFTVQSGTDASLSLSKEGIDRFPLIDNDVFRAAHIFPGVTSNDFSARFNLRGGEKDEIVVRLDGMELFEPYHLQDFGGAISIIDLGVIRRADLFMGGFPAEYGDKMSGVFDITTKDGKSRAFLHESGD